MEEVKRRTIQGGFARLAGQIVTFSCRLLFLVVVARLLDPADFGLVAMVTAVTGVFELFRDGGLSAAAIQRSHITNEQQSTLFWINLSLGVVLALLCAATAPLLVRFYNEPRLFWVTIFLSSGFIIAAAGAQHAAMAERQLRYVELAIIDALGVVANTAVAIGMAAAGFGYWSLVVSALIWQAVYTSGLWLLTRWRPRLPSRRAEIRSLLHFGGTVTLNGLVSYLGYNLDKILLGRFWGADALGLYGRAYQVINIPTSQLNSVVGGVAFSALSRVQHDAPLYKNYFLKGYSLVISLTAPITIFAAAFAEDIIQVILGPKWTEATTIFRLLTPTILVFGIINPTSWLLMSSGRQNRSLAIAMVITPLCATAYLIGLPYGPVGVAAAFSTAMTLWLVPHILWSLKDTTISPKELLVAMAPAVSSAAIAGATAFSIVSNFAVAPLMKLLLGGSLMGTVYAVLLLFVMGKKDFLLRAFQKSQALLIAEVQASPRLMSSSGRYRYGGEPIGLQPSKPISG